MDHEHSRPDRDKYLTLSEVAQGSNGCQHPSIHKFSPAISNTLGLPYDYCSIMHYPTHNRECNLYPRNPFECYNKGVRTTTIGQRIGLSPLDMETIRRTYGCRGSLYTCKLIY